MKGILVLTTADSEELARRIAFALVEAREAACVNIISGVHSIYRWEGEVCSESEYLLLIKSTTERFESIRSRIKSLHTYEVPEIICLPISGADERYLAWLGEQTGVAE